MKSIIVMICTLFLIVACGGKDEPIDSAHLAINKAKSIQCANKPNSCTGGFVSMKDEKGVFIRRIINLRSNDWATVNVETLIYGNDEALNRYNITLPDDKEWPQVAVLYARQFLGNSK